MGTRPSDYFRVFLNALPDIRIQRAGTVMLLSVTLLCVHTLSRSMGRWFWPRAILGRRREADKAVQLGIAVPIVSPSGLELRLRDCLRLLSLFFP